MKKVWRTIFFADRPAAGAWFGLSLLITGTYLTYVALLVAWGYSWIDIPAFEVNEDTARPAEPQSGSNRTRGRSR